MTTRQEDPPRRDDRRDGEDGRRDSNRDNGRDDRREDRRPPNPPKGGGQQPSQPKGAPRKKSLLDHTNVAAYIIWFIFALLTTQALVAGADAVRNGGARAEVTPILHITVYVAGFTLQYVFTIIERRMRDHGTRNLITAISYSLNGIGTYYLLCVRFELFPRMKFIVDMIWNAMTVDTLVCVIIILLFSIIGERVQNSLFDA